LNSRISINGDLTLPPYSGSKRKRASIDYNDDREELDEVLDDEDGPEGVREYLSRYDDEPESIPYKNVECRPSWHSGIYGILKKFSEQNYKGKLICGICGEDIPIDIRGFEITAPELKYKNPGRPHIDHYNLVWSARKGPIDSAAQKGNWDAFKYKTNLRKVFNEPFLQLAHKVCNLKKGDTKGVTNTFYDKCSGELDVYLKKLYK
jgi:hypothetical protein